jgi:UDPglucose 6-dehydrogenase
MTGPALRIGVVGMTHLGLVTATALAASGFDAVCYDPDAGLVARLRSGMLPVFEPDLAETLRANGARQRFEADPGALGGCDVVYIAPDVPTDGQARSDLSGVRSLALRAFAAMAPHAVLVVLSQVPPGFTRALGLPPERTFCQVETLVFGEALALALAPKRIIVGAAEPATPLPPAYARLLAAYGCPILPMRYESAELAKIAINFCLVASISVANTLGELAEKTGADWHEIVPALRLDRRIGPYAYLSPGLGIAGGNLERDLETVAGLAARHGSDVGIVAAWRANSRHRRDWVYGRLPEALRAHGTVGILGLAYKANTASTRNAPSLALIERLGAHRLRVHDPAADPVCAAGAVVCDEPYSVADGAQALAVMTPWPAYRALDPSALAARMRGRLLLDPYGVIDSAAAAAAGFVHHRLGCPAP